MNVTIEQLKWLKKSIGSLIDELETKSAPEPPKFKVGDFVTRRSQGIYQSGLAIKIDGGQITFEAKDGVSYMWTVGELKASTPAEVEDWYKRDIGHGVTAWAEDMHTPHYPIKISFCEDDNIIINTCYLRDMGLAICEKLGIPVRPMKKED